MAQDEAKQFTRKIITIIQQRDYVHQYRLLSVNTRHLIGDRLFFLNIYTNKRRTECVLLTFERHSRQVYTHIRTTTHSKRRVFVRAE